MKVLTTPSGHGNGYAVESADIANAIYKLGKIEWKAYDNLNEICEKTCRFEARAQSEGRKTVDPYHCEHCPVTRMHDLIYRGGGKNELDRNKL